MVHGSASLFFSVLHRLSSQAGTEQQHSSTVAQQHSNIAAQQQYSSTRHTVAQSSIVAQLHIAAWQAQSSSTQGIGAKMHTTLSSKYKLSCSTKPVTAGSVVHKNSENSVCCREKLKKMHSFCQKKGKISTLHALRKCFSNKSAGEPQVVTAWHSEWLSKFITVTSNSI